MKDISLPNYTSAKIVNKILEGKITFEKVLASAQYPLAVQHKGYFAESAVFTKNPVIKLLLH